MTLKPEKREIESVADATFRALRNMDVQSSARLCDYVSCSPYTGKKQKDEAAITWGVTEALGKIGGSSRRDIVIQKAARGAIASCNSPMAAVYGLRSRWRGGRGSTGSSNTTNRSCMKATSTGITTPIPWPFLYPCYPRAIRGKNAVAVGH